MNSSALVEDALAKHDRERFEVFVYALEDWNESNTEAVHEHTLRDVASLTAHRIAVQAANAVDRFVDLSAATSAQEVAAWIAADGLDALVDLDGYGGRFKRASRTHCVLTGRVVAAAGGSDALRVPPLSPLVLAQRPAALQVREALALP